MLKLSRHQVRHEEVVAEQYAMLRRAALHLARGDEAEAGDLLHDTFVRFLLLRPPLERIDRLDGYLYTMLRNVYLSRQRRHWRRSALIADDVDVDLLAGMVDEPQTGARLRMRDDLIRLVAHACERTRVSRGSSAWVLRCLHGYYPTEIAHVMRMPPRAVDRALHVARREAHEELHRPSRRLLARLRGTRRWRDLHAEVNVSDPFDALQALRARVFASVDGPCLTDEQIVDLYRSSPSSEPDDPVGTLVIAHVVACADCLDRINAHLGLSPLSMRDPVEAIGTRRPRGGGGGTDSDGTGSGGASGGDSGDGSGNGDVRGSRGAAGSGASRAGGKARGGDGLDPLLRRTRETMESIAGHVPRELRVAANGFELGAQPVTGEVTVQELAVRLAEALAFIEIFDERGALVCYWPAPLPNEGALEEHTTIELADGRRVELQVSLTDDCPRLRIRYTDERVSAALDRADVGLRDLRVATPDDDYPSRPARVEDVDHIPWWRRIVPSIVPSRRVALAVGVMVLLWMVFVGPVTTWAALAHLGRAAAAAVRTLISSEPATPASSAPVSVPPATTPTAPESGTPGASAAVRAFSSSELADLEMDARVTLHAMKADLGEDITLIASPAGVAVRGVVSSGARRVAIARAFTDREGVRVQVRTVHDVAAMTRIAVPRQRAASVPSADAPVKLESPESLRPILEDVLVAHFPNPAARAAFVNGALARADEALTRVWALRRLAERYPSREVERLSPRSSEALATLVDDHTAALRAAIDALTTRVTPLLGAAPATAAGDAGDVAGTGTDAGATSEDDRLSIMGMFARVNAVHVETHALLAGGGSLAAATVTPPADRPEARQSAARMLLSRLRRIAHALSQPDFARELRPL